MERIHSGGRTLAMAGVSAILAAVAPPIIRAGDHLTAEEETPVVSVHLKAMALGPARPHDHFKVRLDLGGKTVEAIALAAGQAVLVTSTTARSGIAETKQCTATSIIEYSIEDSPHSCFPRLFSLRSTNLPRRANQQPQVRTLLRRRMRFVPM